MSRVLSAPLAGNASPFPLRAEKPDRAARAIRDGRDTAPPKASDLVWQSMFPKGQAPPTDRYAIAFDCIRALPRKILTDGEKLLLEAMQFRPDRDGRIAACTASNETLAGLVGKSHVQTEKLFSGLKRKGWLRVAYDRGGTVKSVFIQVPADVIPVVTAWLAARAQAEWARSFKFPSPQKRGDGPMASPQIRGDHPLRSEGIAPSNPRGSGPVDPLKSEGQSESLIVQRRIENPIRPPDGSISLSLNEQRPGVAKAEAIVEQWSAEADAARAAWLAKQPAENRPGDVALTAEERKAARQLFNRPREAAPAPAPMPARADRDREQSERAIADYSERLKVEADPVRRKLLSASIEQHRTRLARLADPREAPEPGPIAAELAAPAAAMEADSPTARMILALPGSAEAASPLAARAIARDFGDGHSARQLKRLCEMARARARPAEELADAYRQGMNPGSENRGAVFTSVLKAKGWPVRSSKLGRGGRR